jgi:hypothetical protein
VTIVVDASVALRWCFQLNKSDRAEELLRSDHYLIAPDLVIAEITNAAWKFVIFDKMRAESAISAVREVVKAFEELVPTSVLKDRALAAGVEREVCLGRPAGPHRGRGYDRESGALCKRRRHCGIGTSASIERGLGSFSPSASASRPTAVRLRSPCATSSVVAAAEVQPDRSGTVNP